jgi:transcriptional regulator with XRE-family HTH domain
MPTTQPGSLQPFVSPAHTVRLTQVPHGGARFSLHIKDLRRRFGVKQLWLAYVTGCTDAAVSFWESGKRIPAERTLDRIVAALTEAGATRREVAILRHSWSEARVSRRDARAPRSYGPRRPRLDLAVAEWASTK